MDQETNATRHPFRTALKVVGWTLLSLIIIVGVAITVAVNYLTPERLTPIVEREANNFLRAEVNVKRVEISFYSTFPRFVLDVEGLKVRSCAFDSLPPDIKDKLPAYADSLLSLDHLNAALNIPRLLEGTIELYDITLTTPKVNLVYATPEVSGLDIFPMSDEPESDASTGLPKFSFDRFRVDSTLCVRYTSLPDSIDATATLKVLKADGRNAPRYSLSLDGDAAASLSELAIPLTDIGIDAGINWNPDSPLAVSLSDVNLRIGNVGVDFSTDLDLDSLTVRTLDFSLPSTPVSDIIDLVPPSMRSEFSGLEANFSIGLNATLTRPYRLESSDLPSMKVELEIPEGSAAYDGMTLHRLALKASAAIDGQKPDASTLRVERLFAMGEGMGFELKASIARPISNPSVDGTFKGGLSFVKLPKALLAQLPGSIKGILKADCSFSLRRSWLTKENFHFIRLSGEASLTDLEVDIPDLPLEAYSRTMELKFGTSQSFTRGTVSVDSLLTASLRVDTISLTLPGMELRGGDLAAGIGCRNTGESADTTQINPIGGRITAGRLLFHSEADSIRMALRGATLSGSLSRFKGDAHRPRLTLTIGTERAFYTDGLNRAMLSEAKAFVTAHPSTSLFNTRRQARMDSLRRLYPDISRDSLQQLARHQNTAARHRRSSSRAQHTAEPETSDNLDFEIDGSIRRLLRQWDAGGRLSASRVTAFTPMFPLRSRISDLNMRFTTDTITLSDTRVRLGHSSFRINGTISNLRRALTSRNGSQSLSLRFDLVADTINVNEIAEAVFAGAAFSESGSGGNIALNTSIETADENDIGPTGSETSDSLSILIIPSNLDAQLRVSARNIIYSDLSFRNFKGMLNIFDGALNLSELAASTDVGALSLNALYSAQSRSDASFAFGMNIRDFRIAQFLDLIPAIDSLMPMMQGISGTVNADLAATTAIDSGMNINIPSLKAAVKISGDSLVVIDDDTYRTIGKWLMFKDKQRNLIDSMTVEMIVDNSQLRMFPFVFNMDRYKLGVMGSNDLAMNFNYHIAVLKSPIPFKFGINLSGNIDDYKVRIGKAKFSEKDFASTVSIADTTRINLVNEIGNVFRRGVRRARLNRLDFSGVRHNMLPDAADSSDTISHADSLYFIREGVIPQPPAPPAADSIPSKRKKSRR